MERHKELYEIKLPKRTLEATTKEIGLNQYIGIKLRFKMDEMKISTGDLINEIDEKKLSDAVIERAVTGRQCALNTIMILCSHLKIKSSELLPY